MDALVPDRPRLIVLDVNETLSDMAPIGDRLADVGADRALAPVWFSGLLRDGFALTVHAENPTFADLAADGLSRLLAPTSPAARLDDDVAHVLAGFGALPCHPDVVDGIGALADLGIRLVTLTNGATAVADGLLGRAGVRDRLDALLSVEQAGVWKPDARAYAYALEQCGVAAADAMLVAVHPWDTDGAVRAGMRAAWIDRAGSGAYPSYFRAPTITAGSLVELAERLG
ncbi:2-haloacid dehalogenase [Mumia flava]|uniref:2-haloacid dehalogenase n=1 Tax=Mumia flava TaxID=1348852 RepID=A0A0B2BPT9_9ACTN|nr:haloacid dehalogenase type II [Mumia flava]PJJ56553.1 2-haloacid dehalogenase [Mumia flava]